jgi:carbonic anhydrase/acetyltransferase-like protein (isoleucine patch superfamily)
MQALVFRAELGPHVVVEPGAKLIGVKVAPGRYVPALAIVTKQSDADALPTITPDYPYRKLNEGVVRVNVQLAAAIQPQPLNR